jgi:hypothetical protein
MLGRATFDETLDAEVARAGIGARIWSPDEQPDDELSVSCCGERLDVSQDVLFDDEGLAPALSGLERRDDVMRVAQRPPIDGAADGHGPAPNAIAHREWHAPLRPAAAASSRAELFGPATLAGSASDTATPSLLLQPL